MSSLQYSVFREGAVQWRRDAAERWRRAIRRDAVLIPVCLVIAFVGRRFPVVMWIELSLAATALALVLWARFERNGLLRDIKRIESGEDIWL